MHVYVYAYICIWFCWFVGVVVCYGEDWWIRFSGDVEVVFGGFGDGGFFGI